MLKHALQGLWKLLLPPLCQLCAEAEPGPQDGNPLICESCAAAIAPLPPHRCAICALPFQGAESPETLESPGSSPAQRCSQCMRAKPPFEKVIAFGLFEDKLRKLILDFKYNGSFGLRNVLEEYFIEGLGYVLSAPSAGAPDEELHTISTVAPFPATTPPCTGAAMIYPPYSPEKPPHS